MVYHVTSEEVRKLEGEVGRKQMNCTYQKERERNICVRGRTGDHASSGEGKKMAGEVRRKLKKRKKILRKYL